MKLLNSIKKVKIVTVLAVVFSVFSIHAQTFTLLGKVTDEHKNTLSGASIVVNGLKKGTITNTTGSFEMKLPKGTYTLKISYVGYGTLQEKFTITSSEKKVFVLRKEATVLDEVLVSAVRVKADAPVTHSNLSKKEIEKRNLGQDIPILEFVVRMLLE